MKSEKITAKDLKGREKLEYYLEYYRWHMIFTAFALFIGISLVWGIVVGAQRYVTIVFHCDYTLTEIEDLIEQITPEGVRQGQVDRLNLHIHNPYDMRYQLDLKNAYQGRLLARELDVAVMRPEEFEAKIIGGFLQPITYMGFEGEGLFWHEGEVYGVYLPSELSLRGDLVAGMYVNTRNRRNAETVIRLAAGF
jgi:hypothetical protein